MTARDNALTDAVFSAATLCPRIARAAVKARFAPPAEARRRLQEARRLLRQIGDKLALAEAALAGETDREVAS